MSSNQLVLSTTMPKKSLFMNKLFLKLESIEKRLEPNSVLNSFIYNDLKTEEVMNRINKFLLQ